MRYKQMVCIVVGIVLMSFAFAEAEQQQFSETYNKVMKSIEQLTPSQSFKVVMGTEKDTYEIFDPLEIRFQSEKACYLTLMDISTNGDITFLAPSQYIPETQIEAQRVYSTLNDFELKMKTSPPAGYETLNFFCTTEKVNFFDADFQKEPVYTIPRDDDERLNALLKTLESLKQQDWAGTSASFFIRGRSAVAGGQKGMIAKRGMLKPIDATGSTGRMLWPVDATGSTGHTEDDKPKSNE